jgi:hypothetical protein
MKALCLMCLFVIVSCASGVSRKIASEGPVIFGDADKSNSSVKLFSTESEVKQKNLFYLELKDTSKKLVDVDLTQIQVKKARVLVDSRVRRLGLGKYEIELKKKLTDFSQIKFIVQNKNIKHQIVYLKKPVKSRSQLKVLSQTNHELKLELRLRDKKGLPVDSELTPELIMEGSGTPSDLVKISQGVWQFSVIIPEENQIFYFSIRANGKYLERLLRFQFIEK